MRASAQVAPFTSWPKSAKFVGTDLLDRHGSAASRSRRPGRRCGRRASGATSLASRRDTSGGRVELAAPSCRRPRRSCRSGTRSTSPMTSRWPTRDGRRSSRGSLKSSSRCLSRRLRSLVWPRLASELKSMLRKTPSSLALFASSISSSAMLMSSPMFGCFALGVEVVEVALLRQDEPLALQAPRDALLVAAVLLAVLLELVLPEVGDVLQEQHHEDVVLVLTGSTAPRKVSQAAQAVWLICCCVI